VASVEERNGSWRAYWRRGGRGGHKESATFPTGKLAESAARVAEARRHDVTADEVYAAVYGIGRDGAAGAPTVGDWAGQWIATRRGLAEVQPDTVDAQHRIIVRHILPQLGQLPLTAVTQETVREWVAWMRTRPAPRGGKLDADTVRRVHAVLHSLLGAAVPRWLPANPAARLPGQGRRAAGLPKATPHEPMFLTAAEVELILSHCPPAVRDLASVAVRTGLRLGELLVLRVQDVTATGPRKTIRVRQALKRDGSVGRPKSRRSRRDVSISAEVAAVLAGLVRGRGANAWVFTAPRGGRWVPSNLSRRYWVPALAEAQRCPQHPPPVPPKKATGPRRKLRPHEVSVCDCPGRLNRRPRFHDLRHTHASLCAEAGWDMLRVSRRLGHESIQTTADIYGHLWDVESPDRLAAVERLLDDEAA
jgi:integrase